MGLHTPLKNGTLLDAARRLVDLSGEALKKMEEGKAIDRRPDSGYLAPLKDLMAQGKSPAERLLESIGDLPDDARRIRVIIDASQI
jgi:gamma-glutamylcysteine synthetase